MRNWNQLNQLQKIAMACIVVIVAVLLPEMMFLLDVGGIELAFTFLCWYLKPIIHMFDRIYIWIKDFFSTFLNIIYSSALMKPYVFTEQAIVSVVFTTIGATTVLSLCLFFLAVFIQY